MYIIVNKATFIVRENPNAYIKNNINPLIVASGVTKVALTKKEDREKIFEKFYQEDSSHNSEGNGLGLAIVQQISKLHHGYMTLQSELGQGSTFTLHLPNETQDIVKQAKLKF